MQRILVALLVAVTCLGCAAGTNRGSSTAAAGFAVSGYAHAGPTCPVVQDPPEPGCEDLPVAAATLLIRDAEGTEVAATRTNADGTFEVMLPPGSYLLVPQPVEGLLGTASQQDFEVGDGPVSDLDVAYDTGIR